jgi:hypothetical protein
LAIVFLHNVPAPLLRQRINELVEVLTLADDDVEGSRQTR